MKRALVSLALGAAASMCVAAGPVASGGGNSDNAEACQKGGWAELVQEDGTAFRNVGGCVSYAARGGALTPKHPGRELCESAGGTYTLAPKETVLWRCDIEADSDIIYTLGSECQSNRWFYSAPLGEYMFECLAKP